MLQSQLFAKTKKEAPKEAEVISHKLLVRADFIEQSSSGVYRFLPLGFKVLKKIEEIIREEMLAIGAQELYLPALQNKNLWLETNRWQTIDPPLFKLKDRHQKETALGSTHEEEITDIIRKRVKSYQDLPFSLFQIQDKFRNEIRSSGGLLRTREFMMKDLYSFHSSGKDLEEFYQKVVGAYQKIFKSCNLKTILVEAHSGSIGGNRSQEFMVLAEAGEDKILYCPKCEWGANVEVTKDIKKCPLCRTKLEIGNSIEIGHVFELGTLYSEKLRAFFTDQNGEKRPLIMGCYGVGLPRIIATIVEVSHDQDGIIWPEKVSPFEYHLLSFKKDKEARQIYRFLTQNDKEVLFDDRPISPGEKLKDADLIGISKRLIISQKTGKMIEYKERNKKKVRLIKRQEILNFKF